ncbi:type IV fimbrial biogenesis protein FimT [Inhella inkyongensis]|uniref:Type II secretion system protein H n=1 Tax=Inhella inkyongensis TaxID=392593 RepID=A0A840S1K8_9BURK|nr:GspH/FimT family pseudopilin [Inhella inkyongensis]MBB5203308.1 type IV fimbrial biogenesis protein FimT [Inhella inkyongensis]
MLKQEFIRGMTLIEAVVVMALLVLTLALVAPSVADWIRDLRVRSGAESIKNGLSIARAEALRRNTAVGFWMVEDTGSRIPGNACVLSSQSAAWVVSISDPTAACGAAPSLTAAPQLVQRSKAEENSTALKVAAVDDAGNSINRVIFNGLGQAPAVATRYTIDVEATNGQGRRLRVVVESGGLVRMCEHGVAAGDPRACPL